MKPLTAKASLHPMAQDNVLDETELAIKHIHEGKFVEFFFARCEATSEGLPNKISFRLVFSPCRFPFFSLTLFVFFIIALNNMNSHSCITVFLDKRLSHCLATLSGNRQDGNQST